MAPTTEMRTSPYDRGEKTPVPASLVQLRYRPRTRFVPSRFNARTVGDDGRILLWNTYTGAVTVFAAKHHDRVLGLLSHEGTDELGKVGDYMRQRGYLVRAGTSELDMFRLQYMRQQWRQDVLQFILLASEDCNFRCVYCYEKFERGTMNPETRQGIKQLVEKRGAQLRHTSISWFGGEPLYGWEAIEDLLPYFNDAARRFDFGFSQVMTTNGYLLTEERATSLLEWGCRRYQITLDGLAEEHDCKRVGRDGSPTFDVIFDNLVSLHQRRDARFRVDLRVNFDNRNFPRLGRFMETISEHFAGDSRFQLRFRPVGRWGGDNDDQLDTCGRSDRRTVLRDLQAKAMEVGLAQESGITDLAAPGSNACYAARPYNFIVGATGKLMKCTIALYEMEENVVGQLHPDGTLELHDEQMAHWVAPHYESDSLCKSCYILPGCQGAHCPLTRVQDNQRTCCATRQNLKFEMRATLRKSGAAAREPEPDGMGAAD